VVDLPPDEARALRAQKSAVDPAAAGRTPDEMLDLVLGRIAEALSQVSAARNGNHRADRFDVEFVCLLQTSDRGGVYRI
jgi:hypothetical protein